MKLLLCLFLLFLTTINAEESYDRSYTYTSTDDEFVAVGKSTDGTPDDLTYDISLTSSGLTIEGEHLSSEKETLVDFNFIITGLTFDGEEETDNETYATWAWDVINEWSDDDVEEDDSNATHVVKMIKATTLDGAFSVTFKFNPTAGFDGVLEVSENNLFFEVAVDFTKLTAFVGQGTFTIKALLQTNHSISTVTTDKETITVPFSFDKRDLTAIQITAAKVLECDDSSSYTISSTNTSTSTNTGNFAHAYELLFNVNADINPTTCLWDAVIYLNENRTIEDVEDADDAVSGKRTGLAVGVSLAVLAVIVIIIFVVVMIKRKEENQYSEYNVR